jgi:Adenylate and Guanylate cyclase catalytic domain
MARFARTCIVRISELTKHLESKLGPGTGELAMRVGIHSGSVTAGVLRGQKARFQLFGDTMNMAARMESTGAKNKVQLSADTAKLLISSGHQNWVIPRAEPVQVKGKGECQTYWLALGASTGSHTGSTASDENSDSNGARAQRRTSHKLAGIAPFKPLSSGSSSWAGTIFDGILGVNEVDDKLSRLIDWNVEVLVGLLKRIVARSVAAEAVRGKIASDNVASQSFESMTSVGAKMGTARDEIKMVVSLPGFDKRVVEIAANEQVALEPQVVNELLEYVTAIASGYRSENEFHNFEHASHVILSSNKLMKRIVAPSEVGLDQKSELTAREVYEYTYGISNDPLAQFAVVFAALVHDGTFLLSLGSSFSQPQANMLSSQWQLGTRECRIIGWQSRSRSLTARTRARVLRSSDRSISLGSS